ncbi:MAG: hypothetical protein QOJ29_925, partial [Thermoleophilaceae bacterium]|nr:hypothetical protein [Thermoleophilaceae bacterium]
FVCLAEGSDGGAPTGVLDAVRLLEDMDEQWRAFSREQSLRFERTWAPSTWQGAVGGDLPAEVEAYLDRLPGVSHSFLPDGALQTHYSVPMVVQTHAGEEAFSNTILHAVKDQPFYGMTLADGSPVPEELVEHVEDLALRSEIPIGWEQGDVAVIDNYRLMHRRGEYGGSGRDLRALHGEEFFEGTTVPVATTALEKGLKALLQGDIV